MNPLQSRTKDGLNAFEQQQRSSRVESEGPERQKLVSKLKYNPVLRNDELEREWFDCQSYASFAFEVEEKNQDVKFDKELMDDAFNQAYSKSKLPNVTFSRYQINYDKMMYRVCELVTQ